MKKILLALALMFSTPSFAAERISLDLGGSVIEYIERFAKARGTEQKYIIDGLCISACTMITGNIEAKNICATEFGIFAFHSAYVMTQFGTLHSKEGTKILGTQLSEKVKNILRLRGFDPDEGQEHSDLIYIKALELYKACN